MASGCYLPALLLCNLDAERFRPFQMQVSLQHMPDIKLNHALLSTLTDAQRESWVNSTPGNEVFRLNKATQQVGTPS
jgi:hypothetical protein